MFGWKNIDRGKIQTGSFYSLVVMKVRLDENIGFLAGVIVVVVIGKCWIVPWMGWWEVFVVVVRGFVGW